MLTKMDGFPQSPASSAHINFSFHKMQNRKFIVQLKYFSGGGAVKADPRKEVGGRNVSMGAAV